MIFLILFYFIFILVRILRCDISVGVVVLCHVMCSSGNDINTDSRWSVDEVQMRVINMNIGMLSWRNQDVNDDVNDDVDDDVDDDVSTR